MFPPEDRFCLTTKKDSEEIPGLDSVNAKSMARIHCAIQKFWEHSGFREDQLAGYSRTTSNALIDAMNAILGTRGLINICENKNVHPLAQLSTIGKSIIESAMRNLGYSVSSGVFGGLAQMLSPYTGASLKSASSFFGIIAGLGIVIGFVLFYITPFMPFLYFFFAVGGWVKGLFEALVGVPLWALAHLRIDGEGLMVGGQAAGYGYGLVLEIFLRPIMIVMGLLASITIYSASVKVLSDIFFMATTNLGGSDPTMEGTCAIEGTSAYGDIGAAQYLMGPIDQFFYTIVFVIFVYMLGMASFKLIDAVPNEILRWLNAQVTTFNDERSAPAEDLQRNAVIGTQAVSGKLQEAGGSLSAAGEAGVAGAPKLAKALGFGKKEDTDTNTNPDEKE